MSEFPLSLADLKQERIALPDGELILQTAGRGEEPLVILHGNGMNAWCQNLLVNSERFLDRYKLIFVDMRGHGVNHHLDVRMQFNWQQIMDDYDALFASFDRPVKVIAHSMSALMCLERQTRLGPDSSGISALAMLEPVLPWPALRIGLILSRNIPPMRRFHPLAAASKRRRARWDSRSQFKAFCLKTRFYGQFEPEALDAYIDAGLLPDGTGVRLACDPMTEYQNFIGFEYNILRQLKPSDLPVRLYYGEGETNTAKAGERAVLARRLRNFSEVHVPGAGHMLPTSHASAVRDSIADWFDQISAESLAGRRAVA